MYRCVMGMTGSNANGCILADDMGLGKTLQTIALIWTLCSESTASSALTGRTVTVSGREPRVGEVMEPKLTAGSAAPLWCVRRR